MWLLRQTQHIRSSLWVQPNHQSKASIVNVSTNTGHANVSAASLQHIAAGVKAERANERTDREWSVFFHPTVLGGRCIQMRAVDLLQGQVCECVCRSLFPWVQSTRINLTYAWSQQQQTGRMIGGRGEKEWWTDRWRNKGQDFIWDLQRGGIVMDLWETDKAHIYREEERETERIHIHVQSLPLFSQRKREIKGKKTTYLIL